MSNHLKCIIVDDEPPAVRILQRYVDMIPALECVASTNKAIETLTLVDIHQPDILFLDIQMPELTGIQLSILLKGKVHIVFTTAYPQFALEGYELNVLDYLLKPISFERFLATVEKVNQSKKNTNSGVSQIEDDYFFVKTDGKNRFKRIRLSEICYLESVKNYVTLYTQSDSIMTYNTLKYYEESLPAQLFVKIHKSFIVALDKIERTDSNEVWILGQELPLGDTYKNSFFEKINKRML